MTNETAKYDFNREEFLKLATKQEKNEYITGANLIRADLSSLNLSFLNFIGLDLSGANLSGAILTGSDLTDTNLTRANLTYANFKRADLIYANLRFANLSGADFRHANLRGAYFWCADLREVDLVHADLLKHKIATISGYQIFIFESHIQVGCCFFTHEDFLQGNSGVFKAWEDSVKESFIKAIEEHAQRLQKVWGESEREVFRLNKEAIEKNAEEEFFRDLKNDIIQLIQEFNLNEGE